MSFPAESERQQVADWLADYCRSLPDNALGQGICHAVLGGGKRLRPVLTLLWGRRFGASLESLRLACEAVELVHTYSLVHDDLPAMDDDDLRRGRPTVHVVFGEATAILVGDALLTEALGRFSKVSDVAPERCLRALDCLSQAAGHQGMVLGQQLDLEGQATDVAAVSRIHALKTGALLAASCELGAILGAAEPTDCDRARDFGLHLGLAFQARDDLLDQLGDEGALGKPVGSDQERALPTLLALLGPHGCQLKVEDETQAALACLDPDHPDEAQLASLTQWLLARES